ncbi:MAG: ribulose-phosphate 3-epimerase [Oscillospiraceae bacterium]|nr:ribulose-phosphate 3-epimerase [Oscillospiraceae bacterium]
MNAERGAGGTPVLVPSLLACDPGCIAKQMQLAEQGGAARWHLDIMDGHFVENLSYGVHVCQGLGKYTSLPIDAHLMVTNPASHIYPFIQAGARSVTIHSEAGAGSELRALLKDIRKAGRLSGISLCPGTPVEDLCGVLPYSDIALLMSVHPGKGGQKFLPGSLGRIAQLRELIDKINPGCELQVDGGITMENAVMCVRSGASALIAGSSVFGVQDIAQRCRDFCESIARNAVT